MNAIDRDKLNLLFNNIKNNAKAVIGIAVVIFILDAVFILRWQFASLGKMSSQIKQHKADIKNTVSDTKLSSSFKARLDALKIEVAAFNGMILSEEALPSDIESLSKFGDISGLRILRIKPTAEISKEAAKATDKFKRIKISITARGGFHQLGRFIALVENSPVFHDIKNIEIRMDEQDYMKQMITIVLEVIVQKV